MAAGEGIASPTGRDIDGKYLDMNEKDLKDRYAKFQNDWPIFSVTLMCDSWTGPAWMSVINFLYIAIGSRGFTSLLMQLENLRVQTISRW
jgi:hypothetical protein